MKKQRFIFLLLPTLLVSCTIEGPTEKLASKFSFLKNLESSELVHVSKKTVGIGTDPRSLDKTAFVYSTHALDTLLSSFEEVKMKSTLSIYRDMLAGGQNHYYTFAFPSKTEKIHIRNGYLQIGISVYHLQDDIIFPEAEEEIYSFTGGGEGSTTVKKYGHVNALEGFDQILRGVDCKLTHPVTLEPSYVVSYYESFVYIYSPRLFSYAAFDGDTSVFYEVVSDNDFSALFS